MVSIPLPLGRESVSKGGSSRGLPLEISREDRQCHACKGTSSRHECVLSDLVHGQVRGCRLASGEVMTGWGTCTLVEVSRADTEENGTAWRGEPVQILGCKAMGNAGA